MKISAVSGRSVAASVLKRNPLQGAACHTTIAWIGPTPGSKTGTVAPRDRAEIVVQQLGPHRLVVDRDDSAIGCQRDVLAAAVAVHDAGLRRRKRDRDGELGDARRRDGIDHRLVAQEIGTVGGGAVTLFVQDARVRIIHRTRRMQGRERIAAAGRQVGIERGVVEGTTRDPGFGDDPIVAAEHGREHLLGRSRPRRQGVRRVFTAREAAQLHATAVRIVDAVAGALIGADVEPGQTSAGDDVAEPGRQRLELGRQVECRRVSHDSA